MPRLTEDIVPVDTEARLYIYAGICIIWILHNEWIYYSI
jgi:hypothetical protein